MGDWYSKNLGDAMLAGQTLAEIRTAFLSGNKVTKKGDQVAVFIRHRSESLHCEAWVYFSPAASEIAKAFNATRCSMPFTEGLDLLTGENDAWSLFST
jgi:hypothetical protein